MVAQSLPGLLFLLLLAPELELEPGNENDRMKSTAFFVVMCSITTSRLGNSVNSGINIFSMKTCVLCDMCGMYV